MLVPLHYLLCTDTIFKNKIPSVFPESCHDLDATSSIALKGGIEQYAMQTI